MQSYLEKTAKYIFLGLLAYMPFHVFISTWVGTSLGILDIAKGLKDVVLIIGLCISLLAVFNIRKLKKALNKIIFIFIAIFILLNIAYFIFINNHLESEILDLVYGTRFLLFFVYGYLITQFSSYDEYELIKTVKKIVLSAGLIVAVFGAVQVLVLPDDALDKLGYSAVSGTPSTYYVSHDKLDERAFSTLKDPNSLGSYLIIIVLLALSEIGRKKSKTYSNRILLAIVAFSMLSIILSYSRSAFIGLVAALCVFALLSKNIKPGLKKILGYGAIAFIVICCVLTFMLRNSYFIQSTVFHIGGDVSNGQTSNSIRSSALKESFTRIAKKPLGEGLGTAGPSSLKNTEQKVALTENHYLQIAVELGVLGVAIFIAVNILVGIRLYANKKELFTLALLAAFIGLFITNNLVHIWSNEAVAYTWWGLAGLVVYKKLVPNNNQRT